MTENEIDQNILIAGFKLQIMENKNAIRKLLESVNESYNYHLAMAAREQFILERMLTNDEDLRSEEKYSKEWEALKDSVRLAKINAFEMILDLACDITKRFKVTGEC